MQVAAAPVGAQLQREDGPAHVPPSAATLPEAQHPETGAHGMKIAHASSATCSSLVHA